MCAVTALKIVCGLLESIHTWTFKAKAVEKVEDEITLKDAPEFCIAIKTQ